MAIRQASLKSASPVSAEQEQSELPAGFLEAFGRAEPAGQESIVKQFFDVEAELTVEVASTEPKQKAATFSPQLPRNRLYFMIDSGQVIRLRRVKITNVVHYFDFVTHQNEEMSLPLFIESVQAGGVWLLRPKSDPIETDRP